VNQISGGLRSDAAFEQKTYTASGSQNKSKSEPKGTGDSA